VPTHPDDDRLLELAYGEAPTAEARVLRQHVDGCPRCKKVLEGIAEVRSAFRTVPTEPAPERGLESLLAYGEQAAARARSRRGGLRILALLSAATAFALVWLVLPSRNPQADGLARAPATKPTDPLAQAEVPRAPAQGDRARDEGDDQAREGKEQKTLSPASPASPMAKREHHREEEPLRRVVAEQSKQKDVAKLDAPAERPKVARAPPAGAPADAEAAGPSAAGNLSGALGKSTAGSGVEAFASESVAMKKGNAGGRADVGEKARAVAPANPPASVAAATPPSAETRGADARTQQAAKIAAAPVADAVASQDKDVGASGVAARSAAKPAPGMQSMRIGASSPEKQARLAELRHQLETAKGDQRKALLLEKCEIEASLQLGPDAVQTCSMVDREFPGTPEAKRASDLARGFSVQLPAAEER